MDDLKDIRDEFSHDGRGFVFNSKQAEEAKRIAVKALDLCKLMKMKMEMELIAP